ncbi:hypothetical protein [Zavarzinella formosa]|uniref:hypothetical protein n=1 Tax=Zavarzinella formosa TaxID=360055 RepID=UPI0012F717DE|nr:hypothetical protein [Zavarzinella formosa]
MAIAKKWSFDKELKSLKRFCALKASQGIGLEQSASQLLRELHDASCNLFAIQSNLGKAANIMMTTGAMGICEAQDAGWHQFHKGYILHLTRLAIKKQPVATKPSFDPLEPLLFSHALWISNNHLADWFYRDKVDSAIAMGEEAFFAWWRGATGYAKFCMLVSGVEFQSRKHFFSTLPQEKEYAKPACDWLDNLHEDSCDSLKNIYCSAPSGTSSEINYLPYNCMPIFWAGFAMYCKSTLKSSYSSTMTTPSVVDFWEPKFTAVYEQYISTIIRSPAILELKEIAIQMIS